MRVSTRLKIPRLHPTWVQEWKTRAHSQPELPGRVVCNGAGIGSTLKKQQTKHMKNTWECWRAGREFSQTSIQRPVQTEGWGAPFDFQPRQNFCLTFIVRFTVTKLRGQRMWGETVKEQAGQTQEMTDSYTGIKELTWLESANSEWRQYENHCVYHPRSGPLHLTPILGIQLHAD